MIWATIAGLAISAVGTGISFAQQKKAARKSSEVEDERAKKQDLINERALERASRDYFDTSSGKHILNKLDSEYSQRLRGLQGGINKAGGTTEAALANTDNLNKSKANTLGSMAAGQDMRRERAELRYDAAQTQSNNQRSTALQNYYNMSGQAAANAWSNVGNAALQTGMGADKILNDSGAYDSLSETMKNNRAARRDAKQKDYLNQFVDYSQQQ